MKKIQGNIRRFLLSFTLCVLASHSQAKQISPEVDNRCQQLTLPSNVTLDTPATWVVSADLPRYCRARGAIEVTDSSKTFAEIQFEMRLPEQWNGRFMMAGCGGFCGSLLPDKPGHSNSINEALKRGYAAISHDSGHQALIWQTQWAIENPLALELWAHKVLPTVAEVGVELSQNLYGEPPRYKYFSGCSNGGRLGLMAAQRYPNLFDGIAAGGGIFDLSGMAGLWGNWLLNQKPALSAEKIALIRQRVMQQCDTLDGQHDNLIANPSACKIDFQDFQCRADRDQKNCLAKNEATMLNQLYGGVRDEHGEYIYPALLPGSEYYSDLWLFGSEKQPGFGVLASQSYQQLLAADVLKKDNQTSTPFTPISTHTMQEWIAASSVPEQTDAVNPDLSSLKKFGTKLFIYQGWADPLVIPQPIVDYYQQATDLAGGPNEISPYARLFIVPGMGHCWERPGPAPDYFDPLLAVERWVEQGEAPDFIVAQQHPSTESHGSGSAPASRLLCAHPKVAVLIPGGNPSSHINYHCIDEKK